MANEVRLIDANALPYENQVLSCDDEWCLKVSDIEKAPTIDPESLRPKGRWDKTDMHKCTNCGAVALSDDWQYLHTKFCPNCGAKMEG